MWSRTLVLLVVLLAVPALVQARGLQDFVTAAHAPVGQQSYLWRMRVPAAAQRVVAKLPLLGPQVRQRQMVQVTNETLEQYVKATERGYLEVVVPANKGHVFFRYGKEVFDFYPGGFRVGGVRPIGSDRYGMLVPLSSAQEQSLRGYLDRLKSTAGKELGTYDFQGEQGFHCVTWMLRLAFDGKRDLVQALGGKERDGWSMPRFARFMLEKARPVDAVVVYKSEAQTPRELSRLRPAIMTAKALRSAFAEEQRAAATAQPAR